MPRHHALYALLEPRPILHKAIKVQPFALVIGPELAPVFLRKCRERRAVVLGTEGFPIVACVCDIRAVG